MQINIHTSHPSAFISSTFLDLKEERKAVENALIKSNLNINAIDVMPASNASSKDEILNGIKESDFVILIVGERYGSIMPDITGSTVSSMTKWEYEQAIKKFGKDVLVFFKSVKHQNSLQEDTNFLENEMNRSYLSEFKKQLEETHSPKYFTTIEELEKEICKAIIPAYRKGVKTLTSKNRSLRNENKILKEENYLLKQENETVRFLPVDSKNKEKLGLLGSLQQTINSNIVRP